MCEYCTIVEKDNSYGKCETQGNFRIDIYLKDGSGDINCDCGEYESSMDINYCPMCGKALKRKVLE